MLFPPQVLSTLPDDMPLHLAADVIAAMVAGAGHSRRQGQVTAALCRARNLDVRAQHATLCMQVCDAGWWEPACVVCFGRFSSCACQLLAYKRTCSMQAHAVKHARAYK